MPRRRRNTPVSLLDLAALSLLLVLPIYALSRLSAWVDGRLLAGAPILLSLLTYLAYRGDKRRAEAGEWRLPESTLHFAELIGGWPGAYLAQRKYRHKITKLTYQIQFWMIILMHQLAALDAALGWRLTKDALRFIKSQMG